MNNFQTFTNLPTYLQVIFGILLVCQIVFIVLALVRLVRDKRKRVAGLPRLLWVVIILMGQILGPVIFLVLHIREQKAIAQQHQFQQAQQHEPSSKSGDSGNIASTVNNLYED